MILVRLDSVREERKMSFSASQMEMLQEGSILLSFEAVMMYL